MAGTRGQIGSRIGRLLPVLLMAFVLAAGSASAQLTESDLADTGAPNDAYQRAIWGDGIAEEVRYLRPSAPFSSDAPIEFELPETPEDREAAQERARWFWGLVFAAIIVFVIAVFWLNAGGIGARFSTTDERRRDDDTSRPANPLGVETDTAPADLFLSRLADMADRREALIQLVSRALVEAAETNDVRLGRAQTARDAVRAMPERWRHLPVLRDLVRQVELVHFGGRDISEETWRECLKSASPIVRGSA